MRGNFRPENSFALFLWNVDFIHAAYCIPTCLFMCILTTLISTSINQSLYLIKHDMISKILFFIESRSSDVFDAGEFQTREFFHSFFMECEFYPRSVLYSDMLIYVYFDNVDKPINQSIYLFKYDDKQFNNYSLGPGGVRIGIAKHYGRSFYKK
jgi:hypothetical protein